MSKAHYERIQYLRLVGKYALNFDIAEADYLLLSHDTGIETITSFHKKVFGWERISKPDLLRTVYVADDVALVMNTMFELFWSSQGCYTKLGKGVWRSYVIAVASRDTPMNPSTIQNEIIIMTKKEALILVERLLGTDHLLMNFERTPFLNRQLKRAFYARIGVAFGALRRKEFEDFIDQLRNYILGMAARKTRFAYSFIQASLGGKFNDTTKCGGYIDDIPLLSDPNPERDLLTANLPTKHHVCSTLELVLPLPRLLDFELPWNKDFDREVRASLEECGLTEEYLDYVIRQENSVEVCECYFRTTSGPKLLARAAHRFDKYSARQLCSGAVLKNTDFITIVQTVHTSVGILCDDYGNPDKLGIEWDRALRKLFQENGINSDLVQKVTFQRKSSVRIC